MRNFDIDKFAANAAKEIVVAMAPSIKIPIDFECGQAVAEFYLAVFNGIAETLGESALDPNNKFKE